MSAVEPDLKERILHAIVAHVRVYGRARWSMVREDPAFAHVIGKDAPSSEQRFFRWVKVATERYPGDVLSGETASAHAAQTEALDDGAKRARLAAQKNLPAAPSPAYMAREGARADKSIDFLAAINDIWADTLKLRANSVKPDPTADDGEKIVNLHVFDRAIKARLDVMETAMRIMQEIWDLRYQQRFYDAITEIIVDELAPYPEVQLRVMRKLKELNDRQGMTFHADPRA
jgi:hypothetical protein